MGQGTNTDFRADRRGSARDSGCDRIEIMQPDTAMVPNSGPTVASRTTMIVGKLVESAARAVQKSLFDSGFLRPGYNAGEFRRRLPPVHRQIRPAAVARSNTNIRAIFTGTTQRITGDAYGAYAWAVYVAEVSVDTRTAEVRVEDFVAVQEVGKVINPVLAAGQIEGGVAQGIGFALYENVVWQEGRMSQRPDDELHHADFDGRSADPRFLRGNSLRARARWRERNRRTAARRHRPSDCQCHRQRHRRGRRAYSRSRRKFSSKCWRAYMPDARARG